MVGDHERTHPFVPPYLHLLLPLLSCHLCCINKAYRQLRKNNFFCKAASDVLMCRKMKISSMWVEQKGGEKTHGVEIELIIF